MHSIRWLSWLCDLLIQILCGTIRSNSQRRTPLSRAFPFRRLRGWEQANRCQNAGPDQTGGLRHQEQHDSPTALRISPFSCPVAIHAQRESAQTANLNHPACAQGWHHSVFKSDTFSILKATVWLQEQLWGCWVAVLLSELIWRVLIRIRVRGFSMMSSSTPSLPITMNTSCKHILSACTVLYRSSLIT